MLIKFTKTIEAVYPKSSGGRKMTTKLIFDLNFLIFQQLIYKLFSFNLATFKDFVT